MRWGSLLVILFSLSHNAYCSGYHPDFVRAWEESSIVVTGPVELLDAPAQPGRLVGQFRLSVQHLYKGNPQQQQIVFCDPFYATTASVGLRRGTTMVVFLQEAKDRKRLPIRVEPETTLTCLQAFADTEATHEEIRGAVQGLEAYQKLSGRDEQTAFLLDQLEHPNRYLMPFVRREVFLKRVTEAIPSFRRQLTLPSESERLDAASALRILGDDQIAQHLLQWLDDPQWTEKWVLIDEIVRSRLKAAIPSIRNFTHSKDALLAVTARSALLQLGDPQGKTLLFDFLSNPSNAHRYNAIHVLHWNYQGGFTSQEVELLKQLQQDKDESVSRVAGFIVDKLPPQN